MPKDKGFTQLDASKHYFAQPDLIALENRRHDT